MKRLDKQIIKYSKDDVLLFACVRNEMLRLPYFLDYHRNIGVKHFFIIDNGSEDDTVDFLLSKDDVYLFQTFESYSESKYGVNWLNKLLLQFGTGNWTLTLDADELFVYPNIEFLKLTELIEYLEKTKAEAFATFLLDMYSDKPIKNTSYLAGQPFQKTCQYFDKDTYSFIRLSKKISVPNRGGVRDRLFWKGRDRKNLSPILKKIPLVKWRKDLFYTASTHILNGTRLADISGALLHFKLFSDFYDYSRIEALRNEHWDNAVQYKSYWEILNENTELTPLFHGSTKYENSSQLIKLGLIESSNRFEAFIRNKKLPETIPTLQERNGKTATIVAVNNNTLDSIELCKQALSWSDIIFVAVEMCHKDLRPLLVNLLHEGLPIVIFDIEPNSSYSKSEKILKIGVNVGRFFSIDHFMFLNTGHPISDNQIEYDKGEITQNGKVSFPLDFGQIISKAELDTLYFGHIIEPKKKLIKAKINSFYLKLYRKLRVKRKISKSSISNISGVFPSSFHEQQIYLDFPAFRYIYDKYSPSSVIDFGCGSGGYLKAFRDWGAKAILGIDGFHPSKNLVEQKFYQQHDLRFPLDLQKRFDLVICTEVAEHIEAQDEPHLIKSLIQHASNRIVFSAAQINQPGIGHINCHPEDYWISKWRRLGWELNHQDTMTVRSLSTFYWFRRNLLVLERVDKSKKDVFSDSRLSSFEADYVPWKNQPPSIYHYPLTQEIPVIKPT